jgi:hypothetical protein
VNDMTAAVREAMALVNAPSALESASAAAVAFSQAHKGAAQRVAALVKDLV